MHRWNRKVITVIILMAVVITAAWLMTNLGRLGSQRAGQFVQWAQGNEVEREALVTVQRDSCPGATFVLPTDGFIGLLYDDPNGPYSSTAPHQGIDIFSNAAPGVTPVYAAYDGFIHRESGWRSALIQRVPEDPLQPGRQIWLYYAHMADQDGNSFIEAAFPPGTSELFVERGTLLGYTGDYNGDALRDIWVHLHFSIVLDDGNGRYTNELEFVNTLDPTPYMGLPLNYACSGLQMQCGDYSHCSN